MKPKWVILVSLFCLILFVLVILTFWRSQMYSVMNVLGISSDHGASVSVTPGFQTQGNAILFNGKPVRLQGVSRPSLEWGYGEDFSLDDFSMIHSWGFNTVRLPLNQHLWLEDRDYVEIVERNVSLINQLGMAVILDLHWSDRGNAFALSTQISQQRMPDKRSLLFWKDMAQKYKDNPFVIFELYNEPHSVTPYVWLNGGDSGDGYEAVGMQQLIDTIRNEGADNLIIVNGLNWGYDFSSLELPKGINLAFGTHPYGQFLGKKTTADWHKAFGFLVPYVPVIVTEFGDTSDCNGEFNQRILDYTKKFSLSWVAWAWYPKDCNFPSLISDWRGSRTAAGDVVYNFLKSEK